jgi:hypothetical protein
VLESSLDGKVWTEIDRKKANNDLHVRTATASFAASNSGKRRFIRLTQTGPNHRAGYRLRIIELATKLAVSLWDAHRMTIKSPDFFSLAINHLHFPVNYLSVTGIMSLPLFIQMPIHLSLPLLQFWVK